MAAPEGPGGRSLPVEDSESLRYGGLHQFNPAAQWNYLPPRQPQRVRPVLNQRPVQGWGRQPEPQAPWGAIRQRSGCAAPRGQRPMEPNVVSRHRNGSSRHRHGSSRQRHDFGMRSAISQMLKSHPVLFVGFSYCPACKKLKAVLDEQHIPYFKWDVDLAGDKAKMMDVFEKLSGIRTAPQMYVRGQFVGDGTTTTKMVKSGEFHRLIGLRNQTNIMNAADLVYDMLERHPVLMMSFSYCPCCKRLAEKLESARISYYKFEVDELPNRHEVIKEFEKLSGIRTAPQMFVGGEFVGDGTTTTRLIETGELQRLIRQLIGY